MLKVPRIDLDPTFPLDARKIKDRLTGHLGPIGIILGVAGVTTILLAKLTLLPAILVVGGCVEAFFAIKNFAKPAMVASIVDDLIEESKFVTELGTAQHHESGNP